jgi:hypothetical protein
LLSKVMHHTDQRPHGAHMKTVQAMLGTSGKISRPSPLATAEQNAFGRFSHWRTRMAIRFFAMKESRQSGPWRWQSPCCRLPGPLVRAPHLTGKPRWPAAHYLAAGGTQPQQSASGEDGLRRGQQSEPAPTAVMAPGVNSVIRVRVGSVPQEYSPAICISPASVPAMCPDPASTRVPIA